MKKSFKQIGKKTGTDKIHRHGYHRFYPIFLENLRDKKNVILEIGTDENKSIKLWKQYFPNSKIYGIDIGNEKKFKQGEIFKGNQADDKFLKKVSKKIGKKLDFIIDDGSHKPKHQIDSFNYLFKNSLKSGGVYIIEDIETSYWKKGVLYGNKIRRGYKHKNSVIEIFKNMVDRVNEEFIKDNSIFINSPILLEVQKQIKLISFQYNSIIILKKDKKDKEFENREYKYLKYL